MAFESAVARMTVLVRSLILRGPIAHVLGVATVIAATLATFAIDPWMKDSVSILFFPAVIVSAIYGGYGPALVSTVLSTLSLAYFFVPPRFSFDIGVDDAIRLSVFGVVALATAWLSAERRRAEQAQRVSMRHLENARS